MGISRGVKGCIGKYLAVELLMKCYGCRFFWCGTLAAILS